MFWFEFVVLNFILVFLILHFSVDDSCVFCYVGTLCVWCMWICGLVFRFWGVEFIVLLFVSL